MTLRALLILPVLASLAACGPAPKAPPSRSESVIVDPAQLYCERKGGTVVERIEGGRRADLCRLPGGRTVRAIELLNADNSL